MTRLPSLSALLTLAAIFITVVACGGSDGASAAAIPDKAPAVAPAVAKAPAAAAAPSSSALRVTLADPGRSGSYLFDPADFTFSVGQTVTFALTSENEFHTFTVDALGIDQNVNAGETAEFTHTFTEAGSFDLICIPHQFVGMVGTVTVN